VDSIESDVAGAIAEGMALEKDLRWEEAAEVYGHALHRLADSSDANPGLRASRARLGLRKGNALRELARWEDARRTLDTALHDAKASGDESVLAEALLAAGVFALNTGDRDRGEAFLMDALERFHRRDDEASRRGRGWALLDLATLYGKTGRLDLAFVTLAKTREVLGDAGDWSGVAAAWEAQAQLRRALGDDDRWREDLAEAVILYDREGMAARADRLRPLLGRKLV